MMLIAVRDRHGGRFRGNGVRNLEKFFAVVDGFPPSREWYRLERRVLVGEGVKEVGYETTGTSHFSVVIAVSFTCHPRESGDPGSVKRIQWR